MLNDVNMIMHVAQDQKSAVVVSIPRDMVVPLPKCENGGPAQGQPINTTLYYGGLSCTVDTVQNLTGLRIDFAGMITFQGVISMSDRGRRRRRLHHRADRRPVHGPQPAGRRHVSARGRRRPRLPPLAPRRRRRQRPRPNRVAAGVPVVAGPQDQGRRHAHRLLEALRHRDSRDPEHHPVGELQPADTLVSVALVLKKIPLENIVFVRYPSKTGGTGIYAGKVQPITAQATALFDFIKSDQPFQLDANAVGAPHGVPDRRSTPTRRRRRPHPPRRRTRPATATPTEPAAPPLPVLSRSVRTVGRAAHLFRGLRLLVPAVRRGRTAPVIRL